MSGLSNLAFSGLKENVSFPTKFVILNMIDSLYSWLRENHFKVEIYESFIELS